MMWLPFDLSAAFARNYRAARVVEEEAAKAKARAAERFGT